MQYDDDGTLTTTNTAAIASAVVFIFLSVLIMVCAIKKLKNKEEKAGVHVVDGCAIVIIVFLTFCMGLLGTIIGYLYYDCQIPNTENEERKSLRYSPV